MAKFPCLHCTENVAKKTGGVQCNYCEWWAHPKCVNISVEHLKALNDQPGMTWTCERCRTVSMKLQQQIQAVARNQQILEEKVTKNTNNIGENKKNLEKLNSKVDKIDKTTLVQESIESFSNEMKERKRKESNIVIQQFGDPQEDLNTAAERKEWDLNQFIDLCNTIDCVCTTSDIKFAVRLGKNEGDSKPLLVGFRDKSKRDEILRNSYKLYELGLEVSIVPDLTLLQREEEKKLRVEAKKLNEQMEEQESLNYEWKLVGMKGEKSLVRVKKKQESHQQKSSYWRGAPRGGAALRGGAAPRGSAAQGGVLSQRGGAAQRGRGALRGRGRGGNQVLQRTEHPQETTPTNQGFLNSSVIIPEDMEDNNLPTVSQIPEEELNLRKRNRPETLSPTNQPPSKI